MVPAGLLGLSQNRTQQTGGSHPQKWADQASFDSLGRPLSEVLFCVVDLETTGGSATDDAITEIGAVLVRGGEVLGEFSTLVNPHRSIPAFISVLTGINNSMVADAPAAGEVLCSFFEFAQGAVLVAHNAPFDVGFLKKEASRQGRAWPRFEVIDTVHLARRIVHRDETANYRLGSLAQLFGATTTPNHRALADARATVDVLHGLVARLGNCGVTTLEELATFSSKVSAAHRAKRHLAAQAPQAPGVYLFRDSSERVLYIGTSKDLRRRVRSYFTASEQRSRMGHMITLAERVETITTSTPLEAHIRELRLIAEHKPKFNRRSRFPERVHWLKITVEPWPRLSIVRRPTGDGAEYLGPFSRKSDAVDAQALLHEVFPVRQCQGRLPTRPAGTPCMLAEMSRCLSPCDGSVDLATYGTVVAQIRGSLTGDLAPVLAHGSKRLHVLSESERFEEAGVLHARLEILRRAAVRSQRIGPFAQCPEIVAAQLIDRAWHVHVVRYGRLAAAGVIPPSADARQWAAQLRTSAALVEAGPGPLPAASADETEVLLRWVEQPGTRLVHVDGEWTCPARGAAASAHLSLAQPLPV